MNYFARLVILLLLMVLLCASAVSIGRMQPEPEIVPGLGNCDGIPCYRGIVAGKTTLDEAKVILSKTGDGSFKEYTDTSILYYSQSRFFSIQVAMSETYNKTTHLSLDFTDENSFVGSLIAKYGMPCKLQLYSDSHFYLLLYPTWEARAELPSTVVQVKQAPNIEPGSFVLNPNSPVFRIEFFSDEQFCKTNQVAWHGFKTWHFDDQDSIVP